MLSASNSDYESKFPRLIKGRYRGLRARQNDGSISEPMTFQPTKIIRDGDNSIRIQWDDQSESVWTAAQLRKSCPCATCREKNRGSEQASEKPKGLPVISAAEARPLRVEAMRPAGNYGYHIAFSDGHDSGIFTMAMLHDGFAALIDP